MVKWGWLVPFYCQWSKEQYLEFLLITEFWKVVFILSDHNLFSLFLFVPLAYKISILKQSCCLLQTRTQLSQLQVNLDSINWAGGWTVLRMISETIKKDYPSEAGNRTRRDNVQVDPFSRAPESQNISNTAGALYLHNIWLSNSTGIGQVPVPDETHPPCWH